MGGNPGTGGITGSGGLASGGAAGSNAGGAAGMNAAGGGASGANAGGKSNAGAGGGQAGSSGGTKAGGGAGGTSAGAAGASSGVGGTSGTAGASAGAGGSGGGSSGFTLTSPNHAEGATFASKYTCAEKGFKGSVMPELRWSGAPAGTKSYAITFIDVTLAKKTPPDTRGYHNVIYNIPAATMSLPEGLTTSQVTALPAKANGAFLGPCPNFGTAPPTGANTDTYEFTIYALATETVDISGSNIVQAAETKLEASNLGKAKLTGKSNAANTM
jgi:phosphatidylethanolamine-binding protein (PEBP) family uncharacterized protein